MLKLKLKLKEHQNKAFEKLKNLDASALLMDMGTGKTAVSLSLFIEKFNRGLVNKLIVLLPKSLEYNFKNEIKKFIINDFEYYFFGIDSISLSNTIYLNCLRKIDDKTFIILDESNYIKNPKAIRTKRILHISKKTKYKLILTGTPITKYIDDLFSQFYFLNPNILGFSNWYQFAKNHISYDKKGEIIRIVNQDFIHKKIQDYIYNCNINDILELPSKNYIIRKYIFKKQIQYDIKKEELFLKWIDEPSDIMIYELFTELQKIIAFDEDRINFLIKILNEINIKEKILIWIKYDKEIELIKKHLKEDFSILNGDFKQQENWLNDKTRILISNISTGAYGHNFQSCNYHIFLSNTFDFNKRIQAENRSWRIGQKNKCFYIDISADTGIENIILKCLKNKKNLIEIFKIKIKKDYKLI